MPFSANTEIFMLTPLLGFLYLYTTSHPNPKASRLFLAGILSSLALLYKPICLYVVVFISLLWSRSILKSQKSLLHSVKLLLFLLLGGAVTTLIILAPFLLTQTFKDLFQQVIVFNGYYAKSWGSCLLHKPAQKMVAPLGPYTLINPCYLPKLHRSLLSSSYAFLVTYALLLISQTFKSQGTGKKKR